MRSLCLASIVLLQAVLSHSSSTLGQACPRLMQTAHRLLIVTVPTLTSSAGELRLFKRGRSDVGWSLVGAPEPVMLGSGGVAWGRAFRYLAADDEPIKVEGDKRSPAGFYAIGRPFGFAPSPLAGYLQLQSDSICVEDPSSPAYNTITSGSVTGLPVGTRNMGAVTLYRSGLIVNYPTDAAHRAGSCILIHVRSEDPTSLTAGCLALPENRVAALQKFANGRRTVLALIPESALGRVGGCLPPLTIESR
jgi:D-alanyl-D-alanine dipeptidase